MPQVFGCTELGYAMAHGRVILHRQEKIIQKNQKTLSRDSVMTASSKLTTLNLLSRVLELEFGELYLQHFGLFADSKATNLEPSAVLLDAQHRFAARLVELLGMTDSGADILVVGDTLLPLARELAEAGRSILWIGSAKLLVTGGDVPTSFRHVGEDFVAYAPAASTDVLVHEGSIRYLDQMAILSKSRDVLGESGRLILFGEFLHDDSQIEYSALPNFTSFDQLSRRLGFVPLETLDLSSSAMKTLEQVRPLIDSHGQKLVEEGVCAQVDLADMELEFRKMQEEYASGRRGFRLLSLQRDLSSANEWANVEFGDIQSFEPREVAELFEESFKVGFDEDLWNWKYGQGDGKCVVARLGKQSHIVAHYGGAPRKIIYFGEESMAIQPCDVMVHPSIRKQYGKGSLFFEVAATFLEREIGNTVSHLLGFGFPNQKTMNISKRLGLYEKTDDFVEIVYGKADTSTEQTRYCLVEYNPQDLGSRSDLDQLWESMKVDYEKGIVGVRDADYIAHRYISHPFSKANQYRCVFLRENARVKPIAFAVLKDHAGGKLIMDLICPVALMKNAITILNQELSKDEDSSELRLWLTRSGVDKALTGDAIVNELGIEIPCNSWNPGPSAELLDGAWWLTAGDMDFI